MTTTPLRSRPAVARLGVAIALAALLAGGGCRQVTDPVSVHDLTGLWGPAQYPQPYVSADLMTMLLGVHDTVVTGHGDWGSPPGPYGTLDVRGSVHGTAVVLDLTYGSDVPTFAAIPPRHFEGELVLPYELRGTLTDNGTSRPATFRKLLID